MSLNSSLLSFQIVYRIKVITTSNQFIILIYHLIVLIKHVIAEKKYHTYIYIIYLKGSAD